MPPKRKRAIPPRQEGLKQGEQLRRDKISGNARLDWSWVGTEVTDASKITVEHRLACCGFASGQSSACSQSHVPTQSAAATTSTAGIEGDVEIVVDGGALTLCNKKHCKNDPYCLNFLGQDKWKNEGEPI
jgi:hypothetical protein